MVGAGSVYARLHGVITRRPGLTLSLLGLCTLAALFGAVRVRVDESLSLLSLDRAPDLKAYEEFVQTFGGDEIAVVSVPVADLYDPDTLTRLHLLSVALALLPGVEDAYSLSEIEALVEKDGTLNVGRVFGRFPPSREDIASARNAVAASQVLSKILPQDSTHALVILKLEPRPMRLRERGLLASAIRESTEQAWPQADASFAGGVFLDAALLAHMARDLMVLAPAALLAVIAILFYLFRHTLPLLVVGAIVILSIIWSVGSMGLLHYPLTPVSLLLIPLIITIGVADAVHILAELRLKLKEGLEPHDAIDRTMVSLWRPCLFTSLTTAGGLTGLGVAPIRAVQGFAVVGAIGVLSAFVLTVTLLPIVLHRWPRAHLESFAKPVRDPLGGTVGWLEHAGWKHHKTVLSVTLLLLLVSALGLSRLEVRSDILSYFTSDDPALESTSHIEKVLGGSLAAEFVIESKELAGWEDPAFLAKVEAVEKLIVEDYGVRAVVSAVDLIKEGRRILFADPAETAGTENGAGLTATRMETARLLFLLEGTPYTSSYLAPDRRTGRLTALFPVSEYARLGRQIPEIESRAMERLGSSGTIHTTGYQVLMAKRDRQLMELLLKGLLISFATVFALIALFLRSVRLGIMAFVANAPVLFVLLGLMGWTGLRIDMVTVVVANLVLGLIDDDTLHILSRWDECRRAGLNEQVSMAKTLRSSGRSIILTSVILAVGFLVCALGSLRPYVVFGLVGAFAVTLAPLGDFLLLPAFIRLLRGKSAVEAMPKQGA